LYIFKKFSILGLHTAIHVQVTVNGFIFNFITIEYCFVGKIITYRCALRASDLCAGQLSRRCNFCNLSSSKQANDLAKTLKVAVFGLFLKMAL
jgi:hypothetical protein